MPRRGAGAVQGDVRFNSPVVRNWQFGSSGVPNQLLDLETLCGFDDYRPRRRI